MHAGQNKCRTRPKGLNLQEGRLPESDIAVQILIFKECGNHPIFKIKKRKYMQGIKQKFLVTASNCAVMILLSGGIAACDKLQSADSLVTDARQYHQKGDDSAAQIQLKNALQKSPDNVEARYLLGSISLNMGDPQSAEKELRKAISLGKPANAVLPELGQALLMQGQFQKVLDETTPVADQGNVPALRGNAYLGLGKIAEARQSFEAGQKINPDSATVLIGLAKVAVIEKNAELANTLSAQAIAKNPKDVQALLFRAGLLRATGPVEPALAAYDQVLAVKPDNVEAHLNKADLEIKTKKYDAAKVDIDAARKTAPKNMLVQYMQAVLNFSQGNNADALADIQKVVQAAPDYLPGILIAGAVEYALGDMPQAEQYLSKYLDKNHDDLYARKLLTSTYLKSGQMAKASSTLAPALRAFPQDADLLGLAGEASMQGKDFSKATDYFEKASTLEPKMARFHTALGLSNLGMGQNANAIAELQAANNLDVASPRAGILLIMTHIRLKEYDQALAAANALQVSQPGNPLVQDLKGGAYLGKDDVVNARASFEKALTFQPSYFPAVANLAALDMKDNKPEAAKKRFENLLVTDKKNLDAMNALANLAIARKHPEEATTWLERASNDNPDSVPAATRLASYYLQIGEKQKALTLARKLQASNPTNSSTLDLLAQIQFATDDKPAALQSYQRLAALLPDSAQVQLKIASVQIALKDLPGATNSAKKALSLQPDYLDAEVLQATLFERNGDQVQALAVARKIQKQPQQAALGYELEGNFMLFQQKPELAVKAYQQALAASPQNAPLLMKLLGVLQRTGNTKDADAQAKQWFQAHPDDVVIHTYLADNYLAQKQNKGAIEQYQAVLRQQPKNAGAMNNLAWAYQQERDPRAMETAEAAYKLAPDNAAIQDTLGWMLTDHGDTAKGLPLLQKASAAAPDALDIRYHLVQALLKSGDKIKARSELEHLLASGKPFAQSDEAKALLKQM
jgi:putative PEP-CTERM system TPR-repeat lipoprotein